MRQILSRRVTVYLLITILLFFVSRGTGSVIVDGFQSLGAVAGASGPGSLRWPMVGSFMGYDQTWGFHWVGWPWLRSLLIPLVSWSPQVDLGLCFLIWGATAWVLSRFVEKTEGSRVATMVGITTLVSPGFLVAAQSYRPEIPTALALVLTLSVWNSCSLAKGACRFLLCVLLPTLHPLGLVVPAAWSGFEFIAEWRQSGVMHAFQVAAVRILPLLVGSGIVVAWFASQPLAWAQFKLNLESQRMLIDGLGTGYGTFFRWGIGSLGAVPLIVLLAGSMSFGVWRVLNLLRTSERGPIEPIDLAAIGLIAALVFNIAAKNPNILHVVAVLPFAAWLFASANRFAWRLLSDREPWIPLALGWCLFLALPFKQGISLIQHQGIGYRAQLEKGLKEFPESRRILIPVAMWEAAAMTPAGSKTDYRFSTFPNLLPVAKRIEYEHDLLQEMLPGDLLVWDNLQDQGGIFNFVTTTALRHQLIRPPDDPAGWEQLPDLCLRTTYSKSQPVIFQVYRKR